MIQIILLNNAYDLYIQTEKLNFLFKSNLHFLCLAFYGMLQLPILCGGHPALSDVDTMAYNVIFLKILEVPTTHPPSVTALHQVILSHKYCTPPPPHFCTFGTFPICIIV